MSAHALFWLILGLLLMAAELVLPGLVVVFLGLGALLVAGAVSLGWLAHPLNAGTAWFVTSLALVAGLRGIAKRWIPADVRRAPVEDDDSDVHGQLVEVVEAVGAAGEADAALRPGRIRYRGALWDARSAAGPIASGASARLLYRDNLVWVVEPAFDGGELAERIEEETRP